MVTIFCLVKKFDIPQYRRYCHLSMRVFELLTTQGAFFSTPGKFSLLSLIGTKNQSLGAVTFSIAVFLKSLSFGGKLMSQK